MSDKTLSIVETLTALANGVNPITGEILEKIMFIMIPK
jgi:hypothetical protein